MRVFSLIFLGCLFATASTLQAAVPAQTEDPVQEEEKTPQPWSAADMAGIWDFTIAPDGEEPFPAILTLTYVKETMGGTLNLGGDMPLSKIQWDAKAGSLSFAIELDPSFALEVNMLREGDQLVGILSDGVEPEEGSEEEPMREKVVAVKNLAKTKAAIERAAAIARGEVVEGIEVNDRAPNITGVDLSGVAFQLADYQGKVLMLDFWGDW